MKCSCGFRGLSFCIDEKVFGLVHKEKFHEVFKIAEYDYFLADPKFWKNSPKTYEDL